jgi:hypothetical protein
MTKWVAHKSGQGEKGEVLAEQISVWVIDCTPTWLHLPKSEYVEVSAPEAWKDVTDQCATFDDEGRHGLTHNGAYRFQTTKWANESYRLVKGLGGFRVEKKV